MTNSVRNKMNLSQSRARAWVGVSLISATSIVYLALIWNHSQIANGSPYHWWPWRHVPWWRVYLPMALAVVPFVLSQWFWIRRNDAAQRWRVVVCLILLMLTNWLIQVIDGGMSDTGFDYSRIVDVVHHPIATSYFHDAQILATRGDVRGFLSAFDQIMSQFKLHAQQKPPGQILYWWLWLQLTQDGGGSALYGALVLGALAALSIPAMYWFANTILTNDEHRHDIAFIAASFFAITPSMVLYFPLFDSVYPALACVSLASWLRAIRANDFRFTALCALVLGVALFLTYSLLTLGVCFIGFALVESYARRSTSARRVVVHALVVMALIAGAYGLLWLTTRFDPIATFTSAIRNQHALDAGFVIQRPWGQTIPTDMSDFLFGTGWISLPIFAMYLATAARQRAIDGLIAMGLVQIVIVAATGLLRVETSRVWTFLVPLLILPIAIELSRWQARHRAIAYAALWLIVTVTSQHLRVH